MTALLPRWASTYRYPLGVAFLFFAGALFFGEAHTLVAGELGLAATEHGASTPPGSILHTLLAQPFILLPTGDILFRLYLYAITTLAVLLFYFGALLQKRLETTLLPPLVMTACALSMLFFRNALMVSDIPLTLLFMVIILFHLDSDRLFDDLRTPLLLAFLMGLGTGGLHPTIRFLLPPLGLIWMVSFRVSRRLFSALPLFFLLGLGVILFLPVAAPAAAPYWGGIRSPGQLLGYLSSKPVLDFHASTSMAVHPSIWLPNLKIMAEHIGDSFPLFLLPLSLLGCWYSWFSRHKKVLFTFISIGAAAFLYTVWMSPYEINHGGSGIITLFALWLTAALGLRELTAKIPAPAWRHSVVLTVMLIAIFTALFADRGEKFRPLSSDHRALYREMAAHTKVGTIFLLSEATFSRAALAKAVSAPLPGITLVPHERAPDRYSFTRLQKKDVTIYTDPLVPLPRGFALNFISPWFGSAVPRAQYTPPTAKQSDALLAWLITRPQGNRYERRETARLIAAWGRRFLLDGLPFRAFKFANYALYLHPELPLALNVKASALLTQQRPFEALTVLDRIVERGKGDGSLHLLRGRALLMLIHLNLLEYSEHLATLSRAKEALTRAEALQSEPVETALALYHCYLLMQNHTEAKRWQKTALTRSEGHAEVQKQIRDLQKSITP